MNTYFVIRQGWNSANQSSLGAKPNSKNGFESCRLMLVGIVEAASEQQAIDKCDVTVYDNQYIFVTSNPRSIKGLTAAIRAWKIPPQI